MRHLPPPLFWVSGVAASVSWWHFQLCFHPSEKWMTWRWRYQMSCIGSQWICHRVRLLPEWIVIYLRGSLVMLTDLLPRHTPAPSHPHPPPDSLSRSSGGSVGEVPANAVWDPSEWKHPPHLTLRTPSTQRYFPLLAHFESSHDSQTLSWCCLLTAAHCLCVHMYIFLLLLFF